MKPTIITASIITAVLLIFVSLKFLNTKASPSFSILGKWKLDTAYAVIPVSDSIQNLIGTVAGISETDKAWFNFNNDSTYSRFTPKYSITKKYYLSDSILYFYEPTGYIPYPLQTMTDSLVEFINSDSVVFVLKKK